MALLPADNWWGICSSVSGIVHNGYRSIHPGIDGILYYFDQLFVACDYLVLCTTRLQAKPGQSHGLTTALGWPEILESQGRRLRPRLLDENIWAWGKGSGGAMFSLSLSFSDYSLL
jgi:hypothetical protein